MLLTRYVCTNLLVWISFASSEVPRHISIENVRGNEQANTNEDLILDSRQLFGEKFDYRVVSLLL
jgi:hypothetical protein